MHSPEQIFSVSELNHLTKEVLEATFMNIWLEGEVSNLATPSSGHYYFSLKDSGAQVRCAFFKAQQFNSIPPSNGMHVLVKAKVSLYEPRGDFQLIIHYLEEAGAGALHRAFEALKKRLDKAGLFAITHKKPIPVRPRCIGIITSASGAAIHDILTTLKRRATNLSIFIYPTAVQGADAAAQIVRAIQLAEARRECEVLIVARGGGSLEDLWPFNEETVARAIFAANIPIISAIGHEVDVTIADLVADLRAATPTAAAELVSRDQREDSVKLQQHWQRLWKSMQKTLAQAQRHLHLCQKQLKHPGHYLRQKQQQLDYLEQTLIRCFKQSLLKRQDRFLALQKRLSLQSPLLLMQKLSLKQQFLNRRLKQAMQQSLTQAHQQIQQSIQTLETVSPLATLKRGYAIATTTQGRLVASVAALKRGDELRLQLSDGHLGCEVKSIHSSDLS